MAHTTVSTLASAARDDLIRRCMAGATVPAPLGRDNKGTANAIASEVGIDDVRAELLPADKVAAIESLERDYGVHWNRISLACNCC